METQDVSNTIQQLCYGKSVDIASEILIKRFGAVLYDEDIDDVGDVEGTYVMKRCFELDDKDVILYYLDNDNSVDDIEIRYY